LRPAGNVPLDLRVGLPADARIGRFAAPARRTAAAISPTATEKPGSCNDALAPKGLAGQVMGTEHALRFADLTSVAQAGLAALGMVKRGGGQRVIRFDQNRRRRRSRLSSSAREQRRSAGATGSAAAETRA
jgi:hypothetical protein